jgi:hypothetical protein
MHLNTANLPYFHGFGETSPCHTLSTRSFSGSPQYSVLYPCWIHLMIQGVFVHVAGDLGLCACATCRTTSGPTVPHLRKISYTDSLVTHHLTGTCIRVKRYYYMDYIIIFGLNRGRTDSQGGDGPGGGQGCIAGPRDLHVDDILNVGAERSFRLIQLRKKYSSYYIFHLQEIWRLLEDRKVHPSG